MKNKLVGLIPAAGRGLRLRPKAKKMHKTLLKIDDRPILERNICIMRDQLGIESIYLLVGDRQDQITNFLKDKNNLGVKINCIKVDNIERGIACGILQAEGYINDAFCVILGDEVYDNSNHSELLKFLDSEFLAVCGIKETENRHLIKKNYSLEIENGVIISLSEKPDLVSNNYLGCGTYLFKPAIFDYIKRTPESPRTQKLELADAINLIAGNRAGVYPFMIKGDYINVNDVDDHNKANYILRSNNFGKKTISLIIPAYNEEDSIGYVIDDFKNRVDEILVIDNNSRDNTRKIAEEKGAKVLGGNFRGYGDALRFGLNNAESDILILTEADGSFLGRDLEKILLYLKDADMVLGTRTTKQMIEQAANMDFLLRWGNVFVAKLIELLWLYKGEPRLTDVGCTYRGIWKSVYLEMKDALRGNGPEFSPEMIIEALHHNKRVIEIPVTYSQRVAGESKLSGNIFASIKTALKMLKLIAFRKLRYFID